MGYQRSKAPLSLMEQIIMVFVFAFAAAICLDAFVYSNRLSDKNTTKELASVRATEVIETCKSYGSNFTQAAAVLSATMDGQTLEKTYPDDGLTVRLTPVSEELNGYLQKVTVKVASGEELVYSIEVAWQLRGVG